LSKKEVPHWIKEAIVIHIYIQDLETKQIAQSITHKHYSAVKKMVKRHIKTLKNIDDTLCEVQAEMLERAVDDFQYEVGWLDLEVKVNIHGPIRDYDKENKTNIDPEGRYLIDKSEFYNQILERLLN